MRSEIEERLPLPVAEELFWIAVEAFNNVLKHANAQRVIVDLAFDGSHVRMSVSDDGLGFDTSGSKAGRGMGLRSISERSERIGGAVNIVSAPGQGTVVTVEAQV
jgi:signal transduction histidine kinase